MIWWTIPMCIPCGRMDGPSPRIAASFPCCGLGEFKRRLIDPSLLPSRQDNHEPNLAFGVCWDDGSGNVHFLAQLPQCPSEFVETSGLRTNLTTSTATRGKVETTASMMQSLKSMMAPRNKLARKAL